MGALFGVSALKLTDERAIRSKTKVELQGAAEEASVLQDGT